MKFGPDWLGMGTFAIATLVGFIAVGGLVSSTFLGLMVTPAIFFRFGRKASERALRLHSHVAD